ncbi:MAG: SDR family oxidoreductase [Dehalococcoidia bacterium]
MGQLEGEVAIVSGAAGALGRAVAEALAAEGATLVLADRDPAVGQQAQTLGARHVAVAADVATAPGAVSVAEAARRFATPVTVLVLAASTYAASPVSAPWDTAVADFDRLVDDNLKSALVLGRACIPLMLGQQKGNIVLMNSHDVLPAVAGPTNGPEYDLFNAAAWGRNGLTDSWSRGLAGHGIRVNAVCPAPPGDGLSPADVAKVVMELLAEGPGGRNGQNIGLWPGRPALLGPVKAPHRAIFYND